MKADIEVTPMAWFDMVVVAIFNRNARNLMDLLAYGEERQWSPWDFIHQPYAPIQHKIIGPMDNLEKMLVGGRNWACLRAIAIYDHKLLNFGGKDGLWDAIEKLWDAGGKHRRDAEAAIQAMASGAWEASSKNGTCFSTYLHGSRADLSQQWYVSYDAVSLSDLSVDPVVRKLLRAHNQHFFNVAKGDSNSIRFSTHEVIDLFNDLIGIKFSEEEFQTWVPRFIRSGLVVSLMCGHFKSIGACMEVRLNSKEIGEKGNGSMALIMGLEDLRLCIAAGLIQKDRHLLGASIENAAFSLSEKFDIDDVNAVFKELNDSRFHAIDDDVRRGLNRRLAENERMAFENECFCEENIDPIAMPAARLGRPQRKSLRM